MRTLDIIAATLLVIGGLNWGLVALFDFDLVETVLGAMTTPSRLVYALVGLAAAYQVVSLRAIQKRWNVCPTA